MEWSSWGGEPLSGVLELPDGPGRWAHVVVSYQPGRAARIWGPPDDWHPAEPGWLEVESVTLSWDEEPNRVEVLDGDAATAWVDRHAGAIDRHAHQLGCVL